jgi:hypothetical protein
MTQQALVAVFLLCFGAPVPWTASLLICDGHPPARARSFTGDLVDLKGDFEITLVISPSPRSRPAFRVHLYQPEGSRPDGTVAELQTPTPLAGWIVPASQDANEVSDLYGPNHPSISWKDDQLHIQTYALAGNRQKIPVQRYNLAVAWYAKDAFGGRWTETSAFLIAPRPEGFFCARRVTRNPK